MADGTVREFPFEIVGQSPMAEAVQKAFTEKDIEADPSKAVPGMPPNFGQPTLPHMTTFQGVLGSLSRTYRPSDEALKDSLENARYMRNDPVVMECVEQRQRSVALLDWHVEADDENDSTQKWLVDELTAILKKTPRFMQYRENLLHAIWYGRYGLQHRWRWKKVRGKMRCSVDQWLPVHGDKLTFRYDADTGDYNPDAIGVRVGAGYQMGERISDRWEIEKTEKVTPTDQGLAYFLEPWERPLLAVHKHYIEDGEYEEPTNAGRIFGVGVRSRIYWCWYQKQEALAFLMEFLERSATGMEIWYYPWGSKEARDQTRKAAEERIGTGGNIVLVPRPVDGEMAYGVERIEPSMSGADSLERSITGYFGHLIKRYILGQTLTSEAEPTGFGSGLAEVHLDTYMQIVKYDATNLEETMTTDLLEPLIRYNFPKYADLPLSFRIDTEAPDVDGKLAAWQTAFSMGLELKSQDVMDLIGASKPGPTDDSLKNPEFQQPPMGGAMGAMGGMPMPPPQEEEPERSPEEIEAEAEQDKNDLTRNLSAKGLLDIKGEDSEREKVKFTAEQYRRDHHCGPKSEPEGCPRDEGGKFSGKGGESKPTTIDDTADKGSYNEKGFYEPSQSEIERDMGSLESENIEGKVYKVKDSLNLVRGNMPQIQENNLDDFLQHLESKNIGAEQKMLPASELHGTQTELNGERVSSMGQFLRDGGEFPPGYPVLASSDGYILDGHHRWASYRVAKPDEAINVAQVDMPIKKLLHEAREYEKVGFKGAKKEHQGPEGGPVKLPVAQPSKAKTSSSYDPSDEEQSSMLSELGISTDEKKASQTIANLVGATDDAEVHWSVNTDVGFVKVEMVGEGYEATRKIALYEPTGDLFMHNVDFYVDGNQQGEGIGSRVLGKQVSFAKEHGIKYIACTASGRGNDVGNVVWPKFGYDADFSEQQKSEIESAGICCPTTLLELHSIYGGREWWQENGWSVDCTLDLSEGSKSMKVWDRFMRRQRALGRVGRKYQKLGESMTGQDERQQEGENPDFAPEEIELIDEIWDEIIEEENGSEPEKDDPAKESFSRLPTTVEGVLKYAKNADEMGDLARRGVDTEVVARAMERYHAAGWLSKVGVNKEPWNITSDDLDYLERKQPWNQ